MFVERYIEWVLKHRKWVIALCSVVTIIAMGILSQGVIASSLIQLFFGESDDYARYRVLANDFSASDVILLSIDDESAFEEKGWSALTKALETVESLDDVRRVTSFLKGNLIESRADALHIASYEEEASRDTVDWQQLKAWVTQDELMRGTLVSEDGDAYTLVVELTDKKNRPVEALPAILDGVLGPLHEAGIKKDSIHLAGFVPDSIEATVQARLSIILIFPMTSLILICVVYWLFGQLWPVFATAGVGLIAIIWTFAVAIIVDPQINLMLAMVPAVMMVVSFSDIVHLCSCYLLELQAGKEGREAIVKSCSEVGLACWFTSVTTFFGFVSMAFVPTPVFRMLGVILGLGVAIALVLAITLVPIFFSLMATPKVSHDSHLKWGGKTVRNLTDACAMIGTRWPWMTAFSFALIIGVCFYGISKIQIETNLQERLSEDNHIRVAQRFIQDNFSGTNIVDVYLTQKKGDGSTLLTPELLQKLEEAARVLEERAEIDAVYSIADLLKTLHREMLAQPNASLPQTQELVSQYLMLFEMSGGEGLETVISDDREQIRVSARLSSANLVQSGSVGDDMAAVFEEYLGDKAQVEVTGMSYLMGQWIEYIVDGQKNGFLFAVIVTTLMMWVCLRLPAAALISMIPNLLPIIVMGGFLGLTEKFVDSDTMVVAMIAIGIAVDDTIHFLTRFRMEAARSSTLDEAITRTFEYTGRGIVKTTLILCLGLLPFNLSDYLTTRMMGTLLPMTLVVALVADLLLVPALLKIRFLRFPIGESAKPVL
ncbi:MAG: MMPL family transporter [Deltaproteobacteria bacterium]|nr:MMPL family transporter [Deltaproteobacteria bacterium]